MPRGQIDVLLNLVPDNPAAVLQHLSQAADPKSLASQQDVNGYSLLHAAASYSHADLIRALVSEYSVDINLTDSDDETALFVAEDVDIAKVLVELGIDTQKRNADDMTAAEKIESEGDFPVVAEYLQISSANTASSTQANGTHTDATLTHPPPLPSDNIRINFGTMSEDEVGSTGDAPDPEFRRRIEELAARDDFQTEDGQRQLRELITDAVMGLREEGGDDAGEGSERSRRRLG